METINKKQVKVILKVLNEGKKVRPTLSNIKVNANDDYITLVLTDSYMLVELIFLNNGLIVPYDNLFISYDDLNVWYKLATAKSNLIDDLDKLVKSTESWHDYPNLDGVRERLNKQEQTTSVRVDSNLLNTCCGLFDNNAMDINLFNRAMVIYNRINNVAINILLLGMKEV